jgi:mannitol 2-dehydrogenase
MRLTNDTLSQLNSSVEKVDYDRSKVTRGIVHVGVGNFHRAHQAVYLHDIFTKDGPSNWGLVGAGIMADHAGIQSCLKEQDCMWTVVERDEKGSRPRVIGSMIDVVPYDVDHKPLQELLLDPEIKIVAMTVTEGGYFLDDGKYNSKDPMIKNDIEHPDAPKTIFGLMIQALRKRRDAGIAPFTIMSCDNVPHNGDVCKETTIGLANSIEPAMAEWLCANVTFPNSMVDRITPATTKEDRASGTQTAYDYQDNAVVYCEPWQQWVLEDKFCNGRPAWDKLPTVSFVTDVSPYEHMKIRILNGGHASLSYPAALLDLDYVHDAVNHPVIGAFLDKLERTEILPTVGAVPDTDTTVYWEDTKARFVNPHIKDSIGRNCYGGAERQPKFIVPTARDGVAAGRSVDGLALVSAIWCRYCCGKTESGKDVPASDPIWDTVHPLALKAKEDPKVWLTELKLVYGSLGEEPVFVEAFSKGLKQVHEEGVEKAMLTYIG